MGFPISSAVGILGNACSFCLLLSPLLIMYNIYRKRSTGNYSPNPYLAAALTGLLWICYAIPLIQPKKGMVLIINIVAVTLQCLYSGIFFKYSTPVNRRWIMKVMIFEVCVAASALVCAFFLALTYEHRAFIIGVYCLVFGTVTAAMPLDVMRLVIRTRSVEFLPLPLSVTSFLNACVWLVYGLLIRDFFVQVSSGLALVLATAQLVLYFCYFRATPRSTSIVV